MLTRYSCASTFSCRHRHLHLFGALPSQKCHCCDVFQMFFSFHCGKMKVPAKKKVKRPKTTTNAKYVPHKIIEVGNYSAVQNKRLSTLSFFGGGLRLLTKNGNGTACVFYRHHRPCYSFQYCLRRLFVLRRQPSSFSWKVPAMT